MSKDINEQGSPALESLEQLVDYFRQGEKHPDHCRVGTETERIPFYLTTLEPVDYDNGIRKILQGMCDYGWTPEPNGERPLSLTNGSASMTLEPGGQLELAGAPLDSIHATADELDVNCRQLLAVCDGLGVGISMYGNRPLHTVEDAHWMPRDRYRIMRQYMQGRGERSLDMMVLTATVQANYDYTSEADMVRKMKLAMKVSPIAGALFANSPYRAGQHWGLRSHRNETWLSVDDDRCGLLPFVWDNDFGYERYIAYILDVPLLFLQREGRFVSAEGMTFRQLVDRGWHGTPATMADFEIHLSTLFPEVRLKRFIEVRSADGGPPAMALALSAWWKGILYDEVALTEAEALVDGMSFADCNGLQRASFRHGIVGSEGDWDIGVLAAELVAIANRGLVRLGVKDDNGLDESVYLRPLHAIVAQQETLADRVLARHGEGPFDESERRALMLGGRLVGEPLLFEL